MIGTFAASDDAALEGYDSDVTGALRAAVVDQRASMFGREVTCVGKETEERESGALDRAPIERAESGRDGELDFRGLARK